MTVLSSCLKLFTAMLGWLDGLLVSFATPFGVRITEPRKRYAVLLGIYAVIYLLALLPLAVLPLVALTVGYLGVLAVGRAWVQNEKERTLIAKKLKDGDPDALPDLRWTALVSAVQLVVLFPLIFMQVQWHFGLYKVPGEPTLWTWLLFTLDSYNKAFLGLLEVYGIHVQHIEYDSPRGRHLVTLSRLTFNFLLIQGIVRLFAIQQTIREAVAAVGKDKELVLRLGKRAVGPLIQELQTLTQQIAESTPREPIAQGDFEEMNRRMQEYPGSPRALLLKVIAALGELRDARAVEPLLPFLKGDSLLCKEAIMALGKIGAVDHLLPLLEERDWWIRTYVISSLSHVQDDRVFDRFVALLQDQDSRIRYSAVVGLNDLGDVRAVEPLLAVLRDPDGDVRERTVMALASLSGARIVEPLIPLLQDRNPSVRVAVADALGSTEDARAIGPLLSLLQDQAAEVRAAAARNLGELIQTEVAEPDRIIEALLPLLQDRAAEVREMTVAVFADLADSEMLEPDLVLDPLLAMLRDRDGEVREMTVKALASLGDARAVELLIPLLQDNDLCAEVAKALGDLGDPRAVESLLPLLRDRDAEVRQAAIEALQKLDPTAAANEGTK